VQEITRQDGGRRPSSKTTDAPPQSNRNKPVIISRIGTKIRHNSSGKNNYSNITMELPTRNKGHRDNDLYAALMWHLQANACIGGFSPRHYHVFVTCLLFVCLFVCIFVCSVTIVLEMLCCFVLNETNPDGNYRTRSYVCLIGYCMFTWYLCFCRKIQQSLICRWYASLDSTSIKVSNA